MSVLSVYRRKGGGYLLSSQPMSAKQAEGYGEPLVGIGIVESEALATDLAAQVAQQLAQSAHALVSAESFDEGTARDHW